MPFIPAMVFFPNERSLPKRFEAAGLLFIGPSPHTLRAAGDKRVARGLAKAAGIPTLDGYDGPRQERDFLAQAAAELGYPVLIKASNGGGGRGQRAVLDAATFGDDLAAAQREALAAFGDASVLLERYITQPRHIEFQIAARPSRHRRCNRRTVIAPYNGVAKKCSKKRPRHSSRRQTRQAMADAALAIARATEYRNVGTVEFLLAPDGRFYFLEINARLQVEHPVTEAVTGIDLAQLQFRIAAGESLPENYTRLEQRGFALEARICAEDPAHGLLPSSGKIRQWSIPTGPNLRLDSGFAAGSIVPMDYDSLLAKLIVWDETRSGAYARLRDALTATRIEGVCNQCFAVAGVVPK